MTGVEKVLLAVATLGVAAAAAASETITYSYDARGRLTKVTHSGTVNNKVNTSYSYDKADNRTNKTVTGAGGAGFAPGAGAPSPMSEEPVLQEGEEVGAEDSRAPAPEAPQASEPEAPEDGEHGL